MDLTVGDVSPCLQPCPSVILSEARRAKSKDPDRIRASLPAPPLRALSRRPATPRLVPPTRPICSKLELFMSINYAVLVDFRAKKAMCSCSTLKNFVYISNEINSTRGLIED